MRQRDVYQTSGAMAAVVRRHACPHVGFNMAGNIARHGTGLPFFE
jgi:hypothetical protein